MSNRVRRLRVLRFIEAINIKKVEPIKTYIVEKKVEPKVEVVSQGSAKNVYVFKGKKCIGIYDSITKCGAALGFPRLVIRKAIENGTELENGLILKLTNK